MKTFTTYAEKKAKQFLNLLQGYTKGIRITAILILLLMGVSNVWAASTVTGGHIYFDELNSGYTGAGDMQFWVGHNNYSCSYSMSKIDNTKLWYCTAPNWSDATYFAFTSGADWGGGYQKYYDRIGSNTWKSAIKESYALDGSNKLFVFRAASTANKAAVISDSPYGYQGTSYTSLNKTITIKAKVSTDGGSSYREASTPAKLTGSSKVFTSTSSCAGTSGASATLNAGSSSTTFKAGYTANTTLTAADATGYTFVGWYNSSGTQQTTDTSLTIYPTADATYYAYYKANTYTVTLDNQDATTAGAASVTATYNAAMPSIANNLPEKTGYTFNGYFDAESSGNQYYKADGTSARTWNKTSNTILYAQWTPNQYNITYKDQNDATFSGNEDGLPTTHTYGTETTLKDPTRLGFIFGGWFTLPDCTGIAVTSLGATAYTADITLYAKWSPVPTITITECPTVMSQRDALTMTISYANIPNNYRYVVKVGDGIWQNKDHGQFTTISGNGNSTFASVASLPVGESVIVRVCVYAEGDDFNKEPRLSATRTIKIETYHTINNVFAYLDGVRSEAGGRVTSAIPIFPTEHIGDTITASQPNPGYSFVNWTASNGNITFTDPNSLSTTVTATGGGDIYANYTKMYDVQVSVAAGQESWGSVSTTSTSVGSVSSEQITATANTNLGYVFDHWERSDGITITTGDANSASIKITATKAGSLTAHFRGVNRLQNVFLIGTMNGWKESDADWQFYKLPGESGNTVTLTKTINKSDYHAEDYKFGVNIYQAGWDDKWWHNSAENDTKMDAHNCTGWVFGTKDGDKKTFIDLNVSGEYTFTLAHSGTYNQQALSITYPDKSFIEGDFATAWDEDAYHLTENGDIQTVTIPITSKKDVEFRLVSHGKLFGTSTKILVASNTQTLSPKNMEDNGAVMTIGAYVEGDYVFSYNKSTKVLTVTYPSVNQLQVYSANPAHDAAKKNWDWDSKNGDVYTKTLSLNANTTYTFKAVVNSDFYGKTATLTRQNQSVALNTEGGNVTIKTDIAGNYTFTFNTSTKALSVTYPEAYTINYGVGTSSNGWGTVAIVPDIANGTLVAANTEIALTATPNLGYKFVGWYSEAACTNQVSTANPYTFDLTTNTTLYAKFVLRNLYIHADFVNNWGEPALMTQDNNKAVYTYTTTFGKLLSEKVGDAWDVGYHFHFVNTPTNPNDNIAYNWDSVQTPTFEGASIDGVHLTFPTNPTIQFGLTRKSDVTITLTLQSANDDPKPTVHISATPYYNITWDGEGVTTTVEERKQGTIIGLPVEPVRPGYTFLGWYNGENQLTNETTMPGGNITYTARWELRDLHIKANWLNYDPYWTYMQMEQDESNKALYTHTHRMEVGKFDFQIDDKVGNEYRLAYYFDNVQQPTTNSEDIANIQAKDKEWGDIQFDVTKKSFVTITLTLQEGNTKPTVELSSVPYYTLTYDLNYDAQNRIYYFNHLLSGDKIQIAEGTPTRPGYTFVKWTSASDGTGVEPDDTQQMGTEDRTYYAQWTPATYTVTLDNEGGSGVESVQATYGSAMPTITIPTRTDHLFMGYYDGDDGTGTQYYNADGTSAKNWDKTDNTTLHAKWLSSRDCIFFYNNLGWSDVYVYFYSSDKYWDGSKGTGANQGQIFPQDGDNDHKPHFLGYRGKMTKIEGTNIWYYNRSVHDEIRRYNYTTVAFTKDQQYNYDFFHKTEVVRRGDYSSSLPMFVSMKADGARQNESTYYNKGYWMNYPTNTGYTLKIYDKVGDDANEWKSIPFEYSEDMTMPLTLSVSGMESGKTYGFKILRADDKWYGNNGTMTTGHSGDVGQTAWEFTKEVNDNCGLTTTAAGTYVFTLKYGKDAHSNYNYLVGVEYPASVGDYRLAYKDNAHPFHPGHLLKKRDGKDTVSFFVHYNESPVIMLQQVTNIDANTGAITWETLKTYALTANQAGSEDPGQAMMPGRRNAGADEVILHIGDEHMDGVDTTGIYNFVLEQTDSIDTLQNTATKYTGNFYIRTDAAAGGWGEFREAGNKMTYSSYAESHSDFNHYFVEWINQNKNVKFTIANDYSYCISDTLDGDAIVDNGWLPANANVRFGWDSRNNKLTRAYIAGSGFVGDRFLVVTGNDLLKNAEGETLEQGPQENTDQDKEHPRYKLNDNEDIFKDLGNWVYQVDVTAQNGTMINLTALYNGTIQYFKGAEGDPSYPLLASTNVGKPYKIRMIYNFKTNNLVVAWMPESPYDVEEPEHLGTDMLLIRCNQDTATQIQLNSGTDTISGIKTAYAVMTFTKTFVEDDEKPIHERKHYWVSFPFDVKISDVFGFSEYKDHWIMQAYDGAGRAANGLWADTDTYWRYITNANFVMRKGQGYVLTLDVKKMLELDPVFSHTDEVSLYFPSRGELDTITSYLPTAATVPAHTCTIERENRKIYDSHWNMIGVPGFADIEGFNTDKPDYYLSELGYEGGSLNFYYQYIPSANSYQVVTAETTFQSMYSYMVQFAGTINWRSKEVTYNGQQQLAARRNSEGEYPEKVSFRLELAQGDKMADQTFVQLQEEGATSEFDMNLDLTKIINSGANIYTLAGESRIQSAGNALPMGEDVVVPVGVKVDAEGEYTFRMPDGTEGMVVELVDYETYNRTNLLLTDYTVTLPKGTSENRFALHIQPQKDVVTSLENIGEGVNNGEAVNKYLIDGKLIIRTADGVVYDAQGKRL